MADKIVLGVQTAAAALFVVAVVMLFANKPTPPPAAAASIDLPTADASVDPATGEAEADTEEETATAAVFDVAGAYGQSCAGCHGGDGSGGIGPPLKSARVLDRFPDIADQIAVISGGRGGMPAFGSRLPADQIAAIAEYTRTSLP